MQLPFSTEQFLGAFAEYNRAFAPLDRLLPLATGAAVAWRTSSLRGSSSKARC